MSKTRQVGYSCYICSKAITFHGSRVRYNLDGTIHLCRLDDRLAYEKYCEYLKHDKHARWIGWRLIGEDFWKWKWKFYDVGQYRNYSQQQRSSNNSSRPSSGGGRLEQALEIMELGPDILETIETKEALIAVIKNRFRTLAMKLHPDRGGDSKSFITMNEAHEYLHRCIVD